MCGSVLCLAKKYQLKVSDDISCGTCIGWQEQREYDKNSRKFSCEGVSRQTRLTMSKWSTSLLKQVQDGDLSLIKSKCFLRVALGQAELNNAKGSSNEDIEVSFTFNYKVISENGFREVTQ
jgi:hypothetical protein